MASLPSSSPPSPAARHVHARQVHRRRGGRRRRLPVQGNPRRREHARLLLVRHPRHPAPGHGILHLVCTECKVGARHELRADTLVVGATAIADSQKHRLRGAGSPATVTTQPLPRSTDSSRPARWRMATRSRPRYVGEEVGLAHVRPKHRAVLLPYPGDRVLALELGAVLASTVSVERDASPPSCRAHSAQSLSPTNRAALGLHPVAFGWLHQCSAYPAAVPASRDDHPRRSRCRRRVSPRMPLERLPR